MDGVSAVAGVVGLAGLAAQSTAKLIKLIGNLEDSPRGLPPQLRSLTRLNGLLIEINGFCNESSTLEGSSRLELVQSYIKDCDEAVNNLSLHIEAQIQSLNTGPIFKRQAARFKAMRRSKEFNRQIDEIRWMTEGLQLAFLNLTRYLTRPRSLIWRIEI